MTARRDFLRGLVALPMIGGAVTLIGQPTAVAEPVTPEILEAYKTWLHYEFRFLTWEMAARPDCISRYGFQPEHSDRSERTKRIEKYIWNIGDSGSHSHRVTPVDRAALVLSTVGCDWREID